MTSLADLDVTTAPNDLAREKLNALLSVIDEERTILRELQSRGITKLAFAGIAIDSLRRIYIVRDKIGDVP